MNRVQPVQELGSEVLRCPRNDGVFGFGGDDTVFVDCGGFGEDVGAEVGSEDDDGVLLGSAKSAFIDGRILET